MSESNPYTLFRDAVLDLSDEPSELNVERYLAASRLLEGREDVRPAESDREAA
jgi:hypothetical protein